MNWDLIYREASVGLVRQASYAPETSLIFTLGEHLLAAVKEIDRLQGELKLYDETNAAQAVEIARLREWQQRAVQAMKGFYEAGPIYDWPREAVEHLLEEAEEKP